MRFLLFFSLCLVLYYLIKRYLVGHSIKDADKRKGGRARSSQGKVFHKPPPITDELVQDPVCKVYCPKKEAITYNWQGTTYYFCSKKCYKKFKAAHRK